jgi:hypothetical protein
MSAKVEPFKRTILMILIKYISGFNLSISCAQLGILSIDVNNPLISIKITMKKNETSMACCWVFVIVDTNRPKDKITKR